MSETCRKHVGNINAAELSNRQCFIVYAIKADPNITAKEMSEILSVTQRTVERDLATLQKAGIIRHEGKVNAGIWASKSLGCEDFLAVAQAIDGITKISDSEKQFRKRVTNLYNRLKNIHRLQNNKVDINTFVNTRNYYAHMAKNNDYASVAKGLQLVELQQEAILLLTCTLLNFYGLSDCQIDESLEHSTFAGNFFLNMKGKDAVAKENN